MSGSRQMASFMQRHTRRVEQRCPHTHTHIHTSPFNTSMLTPPHCLAEQVPHMTPVTQLLVLTWLTMPRCCLLDGNDRGGGVSACAHATSVSRRQFVCLCAWGVQNGSGIRVCQGFTVAMGVGPSPFCPYNSPWSLRSSRGCNNALIVPWMGVIELFTPVWKEGVRPRGGDQACSQGRDGKKDRKQWVTSLMSRTFPLSVSWSVTCKPFTLPNNLFDDRAQVTN